MNKLSYKIFLFLLVITVSLQSQDLLIFGGKNHDQFLGCMICKKFDPESIWNINGQYGSPNRSGSIWNKLGEYGSPYSSYSPWNELATDPPVLVDRDGNFYGYFTANRAYPKRTNIELALYLTDNYEEYIDKIDEFIEQMNDK
jgi:hypothetical protein